MRLNTPSVTTSIRLSFEVRTSRRERRPICLAHTFAKACGHALCGGAGGDATGFDEDELAALQPGLVQQGEGNARCLASAGRGGDDEAYAAAQFGPDRLDNVFDGKIGWRGHGHGTISRRRDGRSAPSRRSRSG
jgi:hypothetical protein